MRVESDFNATEEPELEFIATKDHKVHIRESGTYCSPLLWSLCSFVAKSFLCQAGTSSIICLSLGFYAGIL